MGDRSWIDDGAIPVPEWLTGDTRVFAGASVLLVEDDDIRELMATLLRLAGHEPTVCSSAEAGLEQLREQSFDLVLTDYALPHRTGGWLLDQASAEGLLDATPALIVTAHPNPPDLEDYEVIPKPFDLDYLVSRVTQRLGGTASGGARAGRVSSASSAPNGRGHDNDNDDGDNGNRMTCPDPIELVLYVSAASPRSGAAIANIRRVLERFNSPRVKLTIHDLSREPHAGQQDSVTFTPTLVKRSPGPRTFILGHMTNPEILVELLQSCGADLV